MVVRSKTLDPFVDRKLAASCLSFLICIVGRMIVLNVVKEVCPALSMHTGRYSVVTV